MENNFELEEMKQQWSTLQTTLNNQKEINIKLILKDAKKRISWNRVFFRIVFFVTLFFTAPALFCALYYLGIPQPINVTLTALFIAVAINALYTSKIVQTPNDGNIDVVKYGKSLVKFKKHYLYSRVLGELSGVAIIIWLILSTELDVLNLIGLGVSTGGIYAVIVGVVGGVLLSLKVLNNIKELQNDIDLIEGLKE
ncbi:MAG: hypothetical protein SNG38_05720 [Rikenellaceae bacterium]